MIATRERERERRARMRRDRIIMHSDERMSAAYAYAMRKRVVYPQRPTGRAVIMTAAAWGVWHRGVMTEGRPAAAGASPQGGGAARR